MGLGKSTLVAKRLRPRTGLPFINADEIAHSRWPGAEAAHAYDASREAAQLRTEAIAARRSFISETVFSHPSKVALIEVAAAAGYHVTLHVILVPVETTVARVAHRVGHGGHEVPEAKIRERYARLWSLVAEASLLVDEAVFYDNSRAEMAFRQVGRTEAGRLVEQRWPDWAPAELKALG